MRIPKFYFPASRSEMYFAKAMKDLWLRQVVRRKNTMSKLHLSALQSIFQRWPAAPEIYFYVTLHTIDYSVERDSTAAVT